MARRVRRILRKGGKVLLIGGGTISWYFTSLSMLDELSNDEKLQECSPWRSLILAITAPIVIVIGLAANPRKMLRSLRTDLCYAQENWEKFGKNDEEPVEQTS